MNDFEFLMMLLLGLLLLLLGCLVVLLVMKLSKANQMPLQWMQAQLKLQVEENQILRNQLRSQDPQTLASLNYLTLQNPPQGLDSESLADVNLGESISYEQQLARQGYSMGDAGEHFAAQGWPDLAVKQSDSLDGTPTVFSD